MPIAQIVGNCLAVVEISNSFVNTDGSEHDDSFSILLIMLPPPMEQKEFNVLKALGIRFSVTVLNEKVGTLTLPIVWMALVKQALKVS